MRLTPCLLLFVAIVVLADDADYTAARDAMVEELRLYAQFVDDPDEFANLASDPSQADGTHQARRR